MPGVALSPNAIFFPFVSKSSPNCGDVEIVKDLEPAVATPDNSIPGPALTDIVSTPDATTSVEVVAPDVANIFHVLNVLSNATVTLPSLLSAVSYTHLRAHET